MSEIDLGLIQQSLKNARVRSRRDYAAAIIEIEEMTENDRKRQKS